jgi:hypothetical protein
VTDAAAYRFALIAFVVALVALVALLVPWLSFVLGPEVSIYDLGSPQLRLSA